MRGLLLALALLAPGLLAGCAGLPAAGVAPSASARGAYEVPAPDASLALVEEQALVPMPLGSDVHIHARIVRPDVDHPVPVIVEFTPYTAPGRAMLVEPAVLPPRGAFVDELVRRGFAFAYADVRGTGDSGGCLDLRGALDLADAWALTEWMGTRPWSSGKVGFLGASYPGSEAHIAAIAGNPHLGGVVPVVASTSFYHYHHKAGVPYVNHLLTNGVYTAYASLPTLNAHLPNWATRQAREATECDQAAHLAEQLDQGGAYDAWWAERDLRGRAADVRVPVLMAQGLADWNVKPDHVATYWNDLAARKTLVAGQWGHEWPHDAPDAYGAWWELVAAFFDETLRGARTGLFDEDRAYVQDTEGAWRAYGTWPPADAAWLRLNLTAAGLRLAEPPAGELSWRADPASAPLARAGLAPQVALELPPLEEALLLSGTPRLDLTIVSGAEDVHLVAVLEVLRDGEWVRENHGYLNPTYRDGVDRPRPLVPGEPTPVTLEMYPQEDALPKGAKLRLVLRSVDPGAVPAFDRTTLRVLLDGERPAALWLPIVPPAG